MKTKLLIAIAAMIAMSANAEIKREDYPSYSAYLAAKTAETAAQMEEELKSEPAPARKDKGFIEDYEKVDENEFRELRQKRKIDHERGVVVLAHSHGSRATCRIEARFGNSL